MDFLTQITNSNLTSALSKLAIKLPTEITPEMFQELQKTGLHMEDITLVVNFFVKLKSTSPTRETYGFEVYLIEQVRRIWTGKSKLRSIIGKIDRLSRAPKSIGMIGRAMMPDEEPKEFGPQKSFFWLAQKIQDPKYVLLLLKALKKAFTAAFTLAKYMDTSLDGGENVNDSQIWNILLQTLAETIYTARKNDPNNFKNSTEQLWLHTETRHFLEILGPEQASAWNERKHRGVLYPRGLPTLSVGLCLVPALRRRFLRFVSCPKDAKPQLNFSQDAIMFAFEESASRKVLRRNAFFTFREMVDGNHRTTMEAWEAAKNNRQKEDYFTSLSGHTSDFYFYVVESCNYYAIRDTFPQPEWSSEYVVAAATVRVVGMQKMVNEASLRVRFAAPSAAAAPNAAVRAAASALNEAGRNGFARPAASYLTDVDPKVKEQLTNAFLRQKFRQNVCQNLPQHVRAAATSQLTDVDSKAKEHFTNGFLHRNFPEDVRHLLM